MSKHNRLVLLVSLAAALLLVLVAAAPGAAETPVPPLPPIVIATAVPRDIKPTAVPEPGAPTAQLAVRENKLVITWQSAAPVAGHVIFGSDPELLDQRAPKEDAVPAIAGQVSLRLPEPGQPLYFALMLGGVRYDNGGPFKAHAGDADSDLVLIASQTEAVNPDTALAEAPLAAAACPPSPCTPGRSVSRSYFEQVVAKLTGVTSSSFATSALEAWKPYENTNACWNPLATTWKMNPVCNFNSVGVQHYQNESMGVQATANTLNLGYYTAIRNMLARRGFDREAIRTSLGTWGTCHGTGCDSLLNKWKALYDNSAGDPDDNRTIPYGGGYSGNISPANDTDTFYVNGTQFEVVTLSMTKAIGSSLDSYLQLYAPNGTRIAYNDDGGGSYNALINQVKLPQTGRYRIVATSYNGASSGPYLLRLNRNTVSCPSSQYRAEYFNNRTLSGTPDVRCEGWPINKNWGTGGPGGGIGNDNFSVRWTGQASISAGTYDFIARTDDGMRVWIDGVKIIDQWRDQPPADYRVRRTVANGTHSIKVEFYENGGGATAQFRWERVASTSANLALGRPARATSQESSSFSPGKANDGNAGTRWSSRHASNATEWWWVDLGSTKALNQVKIRWENAYARQHFVGWSNDGTHFTGYNYSLSAPGYYRYNLSNRSARYVGIKMTQNAPCCRNYSFWEFEVYQAALLAGEEPLAADPDFAGLEAVPEGELVTITLPESLDTLP